MGIYAPIVVRYGTCKQVIRPYDEQYHRHLFNDESECLYYIAPWTVERLYKYKITIGIDSRCVPYINGKRGSWQSEIGPGDVIEFRNRRPVQRPSKRRTTEREQTLQENAPVTHEERRASVDEKYHAVVVEDGQLHVVADLFALKIVDQMIKANGETVSMPELQKRAGVDTVPRRFDKDVMPRLPKEIRDRIDVVPGKGARWLPLGVRKPIRRKRERAGRRRAAIVPPAAKSADQEERSGLVASC